ncbi:MAG TPA: hypothetical protein VFV66_17890 [Nonomuraea sp.]|nr:hypothetical protein [Nonomuraea sp.]
MAERLGAARADGAPLLEYLTFALGVNEVAPWTVAASYATFAAHGKYCEPRAVAEVPAAVRRVPQGLRRTMSAWTVLTILGTLP